MKKPFSLLFSLLICNVAVGNSDYTTERYEKDAATYRVAPHYRHVISGVVEHHENVPDAGQKLSELLPGAVDNDINESNDLTVWKLYCNGGKLTHAQYKIIDKGLMPKSLEGKCSKKGKVGKS